MKKFTVSMKMTIYFLPEEVEAMDEHEAVSKVERMAENGELKEDTDGDLDCWNVEEVK